MTTAPPTGPTAPRSRPPWWTRPQLVMLIYFITGVLWIAATDFFPAPKQRLWELLEDGLFVVATGALLLFVARKAERAGARFVRERTAHRYQALIEGALDVITVLATNGTIRYESPSVTSVLGYTPDELVGRGGFDLVHPDDLPRVQKTFETLVAIPGASARAEFRYRHKDGSWRVLDGIGTNRLHDPAIRGVVFNSRDVTDQRRERELRRLLEAAVRQSAEGIVITDGRLDAPGPVIEFVNDAFVELTGYPADELIGATPRILHGPETDHAVLREVRAALAAGRSFRGEVVNYRKDGSSFYMEWRSLTAIRNAAGDITHYVGVQTDGTARREREQALRRSEARYRGLVDNAPNGVALVHAGGGLITTNPALRDMLGYGTEDDLQDVNLFDAVFADPPDGRRLCEECHRLGGVRRQNVEWRRRDGTLVTVRLTGRVIPDGSEDGANVELVVEDVTEQRELEDQLRQAQKLEAIAQLTAGIVHDFNNTLSVILANAELVAMALPETREDARRDLEDIRAAAHSGAGMIRKLLAFSRRSALSPVAIDLRPLATDVARMLRRMLPAGIEVDVHVTGDTLAEADPGAVEQILFNLATNARDAMPDGGTLRIEVRPTTADAAFRAARPWATANGYVALCVRDSGIGMDPATRARVFEPFFTTKEPGKGTGLGMAMIHGLATQQGGGVDVDTALGEGTAITVYFAVATSATEATATAERSDIRSGHETVLLAEDEPTLRRTGTRVLERLGYRVLVAHDGREALALLDEHGDAVQLVVSDLDMPDVDGPALYRAMRDRGLTLPFVFSSGFTSDDVPDDIASAATWRFIQKPWTVDEVARAVRTALDDAAA